MNITVDSAVVGQSLVQTALVSKKKELIRTVLKMQDAVDEKKRDDSDWPNQ